MDLIKRARLLSVEAHAGQFRKWHPSVAYVAHLDRVRERIMKAGYSPDMGVAAQLHDIFEDCDKLYRDRVAELFGPQVYVIVHELTNPSKGMHAKRALRKAIDREHMRFVSPAAAIIKMVDRTDNLHDCLVADQSFKNLYLDESVRLLQVLDLSFNFQHGGKCFANDGEKEKILYEEYVQALEEVKSSL